MKFEEITERYIKKCGNKIKEQRRPHTTHKIKCNNCGELFTFKRFGPRSGFGKCVCGMTVMS